MIDSKCEIYTFIEISMHCPFNIVIYNFVIGYTYFE